MQITEDFLLSALEALKRDILSSLHVALPGTVVSYDPGTRTASVQPALSRRTPSGEVIRAPLLRGVPVYVPDPTREISPGEECLLIFADCCIDGWLDTSQPTLPPSSRSHDLSDAFALVGFCPAVWNLTGRENP